MEEKSFQAYLAYLNNLRQGLEALTALAEEKIAAVKADDLVALNEVLNREQAQALSFRGMELTRGKLQKELGLEGVPLSQLPSRCPPAMKEAFQAIAVTLREKYQAYQKKSGQARALLENERHDVESIIAGLGGVPENPQGTAGPGYQAQGGAEPPQSMKTDFRA